MKIKLTTNIWGAWKGKKGETVDRPDAEAANLIKRGYAIPVDPPAPTVTPEKPETLETATVK
jgi:hypothetical protein